MALPLTFLAHAARDLVYLIGTVGRVKPDWVTQHSVPYEWLVGAYLFTRIGGWQASKN